MWVRKEREKKEKKERKKERDLKKDTKIIYEGQQGKERKKASQSTIHLISLLSRSERCAKTAFYDKGVPQPSRTYPPPPSYLWAPVTTPAGHPLTSSLPLLLLHPSTILTQSLLRWWKKEKKQRRAFSRSSSLTFVQGRGDAEEPFILFITVIRFGGGRRVLSRLGCQGWVSGWVELCCETN